MERVGRNDPCPCGSGQKFKKCCGVGDFGLPPSGVRVPLAGAPAPKTVLAKAKPPKD